MEMTLNQLIVLFGFIFIVGMLVGGKLKEWKIEHDIELDKWKSKVIREYFECDA